MSSKPSIPKGTRDFSPTEMARRNYIFDNIKKVYKRYGFQQIETPAMEKLSTLVGTGGEESDQLIFKIFPRGEKLRPLLGALRVSSDFLDKHLGKDTPIEKMDSKLLNKISAVAVNSSAEEALRYDLTVPFARYVVQNQNDITFPFRRFQIQPVWRADRPQKGRYREFYQCDADIIGSDSLLNEVDLIKIIDDVFSELFGKKLPYTISVNNRKILAGIAEVFGIENRLTELTIIIDKLDKIGIDGVEKELANNKFPNNIISTITETFSFDTNEALSRLEKVLENSKQGLLGVKELKFIFDKLILLGIGTAEIKFDPTLARGLGYYTGTIIEVKVPDFPSICGGGRYDDLTGKFGLKDVSGVGISFGADRIYDVLLDNDLYPEFKGDSTEVLFVNFGEDEQNYCLPLLFELREAGINSEIYPSSAKMKKQMTYANNKGIKYVILVGSDEMKSGNLTVKNMESGEQESLKIKDLVSLINK